MIWKALIKRFIYCKFLAPIFAKDANELVASIILFKCSLNAKTGAPILHTLHVGAAKAAFREAEVIKRIQQIRFAASVPPEDANDICSEIEAMKTVIAKMRER